MTVDEPKQEAMRLDPTERAGLARELLVTLMLCRSLRSSGFGSRRLSVVGFSLKLERPSWSPWTKCSLRLELAAPRDGSHLLRSGCSA